MTMLVKKWHEARLLWHAKGYTIEEVAAELQAQVDSGKRKELADFGLSESTVARGTRSKRFVHPSFAQLVEELETKPGRREAMDIVEAGLRIVRGLPERSDKQPQEIAKALLAIFPTEAIAKALVDALLERATQTSGPGSLLDTVACVIADRLRATKLVQELVQHLEHLGAKQLALVAGMASAVAVAAAGGVWLVLGAVSGHAPPASTYSSTKVVVMNEGGPPLIFEAQALLGATQMGEKPLDQHVPNQPLPGQKVPPCLSEAYEVAIGGGCWLGIKDAKPPCGRFAFRSGDSCYRPVAADPQRPVGCQTEVNGQERR